MKQNPYNHLGRRDDLAFGLEANPWLEYEAKKAEIFRTAKSAEEYERRMKEMIAELNV